MDPAAAPQRTTTIDYLGLSTSMVREDVTGESASRGVKTYGVDATGLKTFMNFAPTTGATEAAGRSWFGFDVHSSTSLLIHENGAARASYGYDPYGDAPVDARRWTDTPDHSGNPSGTANDGQSYGDLVRGDHLRQDPLNPIRYNAKRLSSGDGGLDFGARRFSSDYKRFYQRDSYAGASADAGLGGNAWNSNRYALAGRNPVTGVDLDGHYVVVVCGFGTDCPSENPSTGTFSTIISSFGLQTGDYTFFDWNARGHYPAGLGEVASATLPTGTAAPILEEFLEKLHNGGKGYTDFQLIGCKNSPAGPSRCRGYPEGR